MKKLLLIISCIILLVGCGKSKEDNKFDTEPLEDNRNMSIKIGESFGVENVISISLNDYGFCNKLMSINGKSDKAKEYYETAIKEKQEQTFFAIRAIATNNSVLDFNINDIVNVELIFDGNYRYNASVVTEKNFESEMNKYSIGFNMPDNSKVEHKNWRNCAILSRKGTYLEIDGGVAESAKEVEIKFSIKTNVQNNSSNCKLFSVILPLESKREIES